MILTDWRRWLDNLARLTGSRPRRGRRAVAPRRPFAPRLEPLEVRWVPAITSTTPFPIAATEGTAFTGSVASFTTDTPTDSFTATINWGDGTTDTVTPTASGADSSTFSVTGTHTYADEQSNLPVTVTVVETGTSPDTATVNDTATATDADTLATAASQPTVAPTEGQAFSGAVAVFTDTGYPTNSPTDFTGTIDWGDGTTDTGTVSGDGSGNFTVSGTHTYADEGTFPLSVTLADDAPGTASATASATVTVAEGDTLTGTATPVSATEGATFSGTVATFSDTDTDNTSADFTATIDWGDGTTTAGTVTGGSGSFTVSGSHAYAEETPAGSSETVTVTLADEAPGTASASAVGSATVADASLTAQGTSFSEAQGTTFTAEVATFTDADPNGTATDYTATINWGDGTTTSGTVSGTESSGFQVNGQHAYAQAGTYTVLTTIQDVGGASATADSTATVGTASYSLTPVPVQATEGMVMSGVEVATFTHGGGAEPAGQFTVTIAWGDGAASAGTVTQGADGVYTVTGTHSYADEPLGLDAPVPGLPAFTPGTRAYPITVAVSDASSAASGLTVGLVLEPPLPAAATDVALFGPRGTPVDRYASELFTTLHGSPIDAATLNSWSDTVNRHGRRALVVSILTPSVLSSLHQRAIQAGGGASPLALINAYYEILLGRSLDLTQPVPALANADSPNFERDLVRVILTSDEFFSLTAL